MVKVKYDKQGPFVKYKRKKFRVSKKLAKSSENELLKWLVQKIISLSSIRTTKGKVKKKDNKPKEKKDNETKAKKKKGWVDPNFKKAEIYAKQTEDKEGVKSYINSIRKQQDLPALEYVGILPKQQQNGLSAPQPRDKDLMIPPRVTLGPGPTTHSSTSSTPPGYSSSNYNQGQSYVAVDSRDYVAVQKMIVKLKKDVKLH